MMSYEEYEIAAIEEIRSAIKNAPYGDKDKYIRMCIPYLHEDYYEKKWEANYFGWDEINTSGIWYGAYMSYPGLEFLGGPSGDEIENEKRLEESGK